MIWISEGLLYSIKATCILLIIYTVTAHLYALNVTSPHLPLLQHFFKLLYINNTDVFILLLHNNHFSYCQYISLNF